MNDITLFWIYLGYELLLGLPLFFYFRFRKGETQTGMPKPLRYFPVAGWLFRRWTNPEATPLPRVKITPAVVIVGIYTVVGGLFLLWLGSQTDKTESGHLFGIFIDLGIAILFIIFFLLYVLGFLFLYFVLIYHPAKKKTESGLMQKVWEARNHAAGSDPRGPSEGNPDV